MIYYTNKKNTEPKKRKKKEKNKCVKYMNVSQLRPKHTTNPKHSY